MLKGYKEEDPIMKDGPYGPYHEPKGADIEKALLQFLLDNDCDVHQLLIERNRNQKVECFVPFDNRDKIKIVAR